MFNIDFYDLIFFEDYSSDFVNFAEDTIRYECEPTLNEVRNKLEITTEKKLGWFSFNNLEANAPKCYLFISPYQPIPANVQGSINESSNYEKLLGTYIYSNFSFEYHKNRIFRNLFIYLLLKLYLPLVHKIASANKFQLYHKIK